MSDVRFEDIRKFTELKLWPIKQGVSEYSCLAHDFNVAGLDGLEFMEEYADTFDVDLTGFDWVKFFGPEASANPFSLMTYIFKRFVKGIPARELVGLPELTLGHLTICANSKKWSNP